MKVYIGSRGEYDNYSKIVKVDTDWCRVRDALLELPVHIKGWQQVEANRWESGSDFIQIEEFTIPLDYIIKAIPKSARNVRKFLSLVSRRVHYSIFRS